MEHISTAADQIIANLQKMIDDNRAKATAAANKIGTDQHTKHLGAEHERHAETAQLLARRQAGWEAAKKQGFVR